MTEDRRVAVIGLGYVGLPLAISFAEAGLTVDGVDAYAGRVTELNAGISPIDDVTNERLAAALADGLTVRGPETTDLAAADVIFVCVPTPITTTKDPDLAPVLAAAETIRGAIRAGQLIVLQSTTYPGTTTGPFRDVLEMSGLRAGVDFDLPSRGGAPGERDHRDHEHQRRAKHESSSHNRACLNDLAPLRPLRRVRERRRPGRGPHYWIFH